MIHLHKPFVIDKIVSIHYFEYTSTYCFAGESHDFWEFLYVDKGEVLVCADSQEVCLKKGQIIFHRPGEFHSLCSCAGTAPNLVVMSFVCNSKHMQFFHGYITTLGDKGKALLGTILSEASDAFLSNLGDPYLMCLERNPQAPFGCEQVIANALEELLLRLVRHAQQASFDKSSTRIKEYSHHDLITKITAYLQDHLDCKLSLQKICRDNLVGKSYLQKVFRERTGGGVIDYFGQLKIEAAKIKIREGCCNFTEIASLLGYSSIHYFSRHFKKSTGMTPSEYASSVKNLSSKTSDSIFLSK